VLLSRLAENIDSSPVGAGFNGFLYPELNWQYGDALTESGIKWIKLDELSWDQVEYETKSQYKLSDLEDLIIRLESHGAKLVGFIGGGNTLYDQITIPLPNSKYYSNFLAYVAKVAETFADRISYWQIGEFPNYPADSPRIPAVDFAKIVKDVTSKISRYQPRAQIIAGGIGELDINYLRELINSGIGNSADYIGLEIEDLDDIPENIGGLSGTSSLQLALENIRQVLEDTGLKLAFTGVGFPSNIYVRDKQYDLNITPESQAVYLARIYLLAFSLDISLIIHRGPMEAWGDLFTVPLTGTSNAHWGTLEPYNSQNSILEIPMSQFQLYKSARLIDIGDGKTEIEFPYRESYVEADIQLDQLKYLFLWLDIRSDWSGKAFQIRLFLKSDPYNIQNYIAQSYLSGQAHTVPVYDILHSGEQAIFRIQAIPFTYTLQITPQTEGKMYLQRVIFYEAAWNAKPGHKALENCAALLGDAVRLNKSAPKYGKIKPPQGINSFTVRDLWLQHQKYGNLFAYWLVVPYTETEGTVEIGLPTGYISDALAIEMNSGRAYAFPDRIEISTSWISDLPAWGGPVIIGEQSLLEPLLDKTNVFSPDIESPGIKQCLLSNSAIKLTWNLAGNTKLSIFNLQGALVWTKKCIQNEAIIPAHYFPSSIYFVQASNEWKSVFGKIVLLR